MDSPVIRSVRIALGSACAVVGLEDPLILASHVLTEQVPAVVALGLGLAQLIRRRRLPPAKALPNGLTATVVLGVPICNLDYDGVVDRIERWVKQRAHQYIGVCPVHSLIDAWLSEAHRRNLLGAAVNTGDGMPVVWAQKLLGHREATRVYGPTLMLKALERAQRRGWRVALYGGSVEQLAALREKLLARMPGLHLVAAISPPFRPLSVEEDATVVAQLREADADLIFVALGCPRQEQWRADHSPRLRGVMIGVGAAFAIHAGAVRQAPPRIQSLGLEWAFRLWQEPRRLFRRYATANPLYVVLVTWQVFAHKILRRKCQVILTKGEYSHD